METGNYDFFTTHDSDDTSDPERFEKIIDIFKNESIVGLSTGETRIGGEVPDWFGEATKSTEAHAFYRKVVFDSLGYFDNSLFFADVDYWSRAQIFTMINTQFILDRSDEIMYFANMTGSNMITTYDAKERLRYNIFSKYRLSKLAKTKDLYFPYFEIEDSAKVKGLIAVDSSLKQGNA
jgi:hypothetical protein